MPGTASNDARPLHARLGLYLPYLAFGAFFSTLPFLPPQYSLFGSLVATGAEYPNFLAVLAVCGLAGALVAAVWETRHSQRAVVQRPFLLVGCVLYVGGCAAIALVSSGVLAGGKEVLYAACLMCGVGVIAPGIAWGFLFSRLTLNEALGCAACGIGLGAAANLPFVLGLIEGRQLAFFVLLAIGLAVPLEAVARSLLSCAPACEEYDGFDLPAVSKPESRQSMLPTVLSMCPGLFLLVLASSARCAAYDAGIMVNEYRLYESAAPIIAAVIVLVLLAVKKRMDLFEIATFYIPVIAVGFFVCTSFSVNTPLFDFGFLASSVLLSLIVLLTLASLAAIARIGELSPWLLYSLLYAGIALFSLVGMNLYALLGPDVGAGLLVLATAYFVFIILLALVRMRRLLVLAGKPEPGTDVHAGPATRERLAELYRLTDREREIFEYVAAGHNSPYIARKLFISEHTVRTHMRNMYRKFNVGSKEELIGFYESQVQELERESRRV